MADPIVNVTTRTYNIQVTKKENKVVISAPGPQGAVGVGFPIGGTTGQFLTKIDGTNYNTQWITLPSYQPLDSDLTGIAALSQNGLLRKTSGTWVMDSTTYLVASDLSSYLTITSAAATYSSLTHNHNGVYQPVGNYLTSYTETDPVFLASPAYTITSQQIANWNNPTVFPSQSGNNGKFLKTNGSTTSWATIDALPSQSGNTGKYLTTDGSSASWGTLDLSLYLTTLNAASLYQTKDQDLTDISALTGNGIIRKTAGTWGMDNSVYLTSYTETDTLSSVTGRGASTSSAISITNTTQSTSYSTGSLIVSGGVGIAKNLYVQGNIVLTGNIDINGTITGNLTQVNVTDLNVTDSLIYLGSENLTSDTLDIGFNGAYRPSGDTSGHKHTGFARDHNDSGIWKLFSGAAEITGNDIDFGLNDVNVNFDQLKIRSLIVTDASTTRTNLGSAKSGANNDITSLTALSTPLSVSQGGTGTNASTGANSVMLRDANQNTIINNISFGTATTVTNASTPLTLTITSPAVQNFTGSANQTVNMPDATTLPVGQIYYFNNRGNSTVSLKYSSSGNTIYIITGGGATQLTLISNSTADGTWQQSAFLPSNVYWGTSALDASSASAKFANITVKGLASQTADLLQIQNSASTVLGGRNSNAQIYTGSITTIKTTTGGTIQSIATGANPLVTMASIHGLGSGDLVTLANTTNATYDGTFVISNPSGSTFNITTTLTTGQAGTGGTVSVPVQMSITAKSNATVPLSISQASASGTDLIQVSLPTNKAFWLDQYARLRIGGSVTSINPSTAIIQSYSNNETPLSLKASGTSQYADLATYLNSSNTTLGGINAVGQTYTGSTIPITTAIGAAGAITSAAYVSATSATFTVAQTAQIFAVGQVITITGVSGGNYNQVVTVTGVATVTAGTTYTFTATGAGFTNVAGTGGAFALSPSGNGTTATINLISASNLAIGDLINVSGFTGVTTYNTGTGVYAVVTAVSNTAPYTVSYANTSTGTAANGAINIPYQATITARSLGTPTLALNAPTSYTGNLINFLINGVSFGRVDSGGIRMPSIANPSAFANSNINFQTTGTLISASTSASTSIPLKIQNTNTGTISGDLTQWLNNTGATILASVGFDGAIRTTVGFGSVTSGKTFGYPNFDTGAFGFYGGTASDKKLVVRGTGAAGSYTQTADLQQWQTYDGTTQTIVAKVDYLGNMTAVSITLSSDERLKKNITPISGALDKVNKLNGYTFSRLDGNQREVGVIAQEVLEVMPELVKESDGYYSVAYPNMVALLIESIKELKREIEELKNK